MDCEAIQDSQTNLLQIDTSHSIQSSQDFFAPEQFDGQGTFEGGQLLIKTDDTYYHPGEKVTGKIYIRTDKKLDAYLLRLRVRGKEKSCFRYQIDDELVDKANTYNYFDSKFNAFHFKSLLNPGDYSLPFEFHLPSYLPASILWERPQEYAKPQIKIKYSIKAILHIKDQEIKYKHHLIIHEPSVEFQQNSTHQQQVSLAKVCMCIKVNPKQFPCWLSAGQTNIAASFDRNIFYPNEVANTVVKVNNSQCSLLIKEILFRVVQKITISGTGSQKFTKSFSVLENKHQSNIMPFSPEVTKMIQLNLADIKFDVQTKKEKKMGSLSSKIVARTPEEMLQLKHLAPACHSKFCTNEYFLQTIVKYQVEFDCDGHDPTFQIPMTIVPSSNVELQDPQDLQPIELDQLKINIESSKNFH